MTRASRLQNGADGPTPLRAGPLAMEFDAGALRRIRLGSTEVVRKIEVAVRDRNWGTVPAQIRELMIDRYDDGFTIKFVADHRAGSVDFAWYGTIGGAPDGTIEFALRGRARTTFLRNRIGLCVLHPVRECAGRPCTVETVRGEVRASAFPDRIAPRQPFRDVRAIAHEVAPGLRIEVRLDGETFETEDQRNWTDASFKTYGTPLDLPFPVEVEAGTVVEQWVTIRLLGPIPEATEPAPTDLVPIAVGTEALGPLPEIGLGLPRDGVPTTTGREVDRLRALNLALLRLDLDLDLDADAPDAEARLRAAGDLARSLGARLLVALHLPDVGEDAALAGLARLLETDRPPIRAVFLRRGGGRVTTQEQISLARSRLAAAGVEPPLILAGTDASFAELNRGYPPTPDADGLVYSINPQVHAFDDASLFETPEAQAMTVRDARELAGGRPVVVGPVTFRPRFNPNATSPEPETAPGEPHPQADPRQWTGLGAAWTLASLAALAGAGAAGVIFYETTGPLGIVSAGDGPVAPLYHVLADVGELAGAEVLTASSAAPGEVAALALRSGDRLRVLVANLTSEHRRARVEGLGPTVAVRALDENSEAAATRDPEAFRGRDVGEVETHHGAIDLALGPYAVARIDGGRP